MNYERPLLDAARQLPRRGIAQHFPVALTETHNAGKAVPFPYPLARIFAHGDGREGRLHLRYEAAPQRGDAIISPPQHGTLKIYSDLLPALSQVGMLKQNISTFET